MRTRDDFSPVLCEVCNRETGQMYSDGAGTFLCVDCLMNIPDEKEDGMYTTDERTELVRIFEVIAETPQYHTPDISDEQIALLEPLVEDGIVATESYYAEDGGRWTNLYFLAVPMADAIAHLDTL